MTDTMPVLLGRLSALPALVAAASSLAAAPAVRGAGADAYYEVPLERLEIERRPTVGWHDARAVHPRVVLEGEGEAYFAPSPLSSQWDDPFATGSSIVVRAPAGEEVRGQIQLPNASWDRLERAVFTIDPASADEGAEDAFRRARHLFYARLAGGELPGTAWFRHRAGETRDAAGEAHLLWTRSGTDTDPVQTYALFTGGRALAENLQLDRDLPARAEAGEAEERVPLASLRGVDVREWEPELEGEDAPADDLAALVPADQHALFFGSFSDLALLADETSEFGAPALGAMEEGSQSALTLERYERQLALPLDDVARALGPLVVSSVAVTGSDPYLRTGSDVAVLFETGQPAVLRAFARSQHEAALAEEPGCEAVEGAVAGVAYRGVVAPARRVSSFLAEVEGRVVVANSLAQLERVAATADGGPALAGAPEYRWFRRRYSLVDPAETALLVVPDAAIRRWCGPRWRIATSRRTRALAAIADLQATRLAEIETGAEPRPLEAPSRLERYGPWRLGPHGIVSETYGTLDFLTPIAELELGDASAEEARLYGLWRDGYQRNWSNYFDPIAVRFTVGSDRVAADVTVIPLIVGSDYRGFAELVGDATLAPGHGDPHPEAIAQYSMAIDTDSDPMRELAHMLGGFPSVGAHPLAWFRGDLALYADDGPFWDELARAEDLEDVQETIEVDLNELPVLLHLGVSSPLKLATFLTSLRALSDDTVPGMLAWETLEAAEGQAYVRVGSQHLFGDDYSIYYAATPRSLLVGLNEEAMRRAVLRAYERLEPTGGGAGGANGNAPSDFALGAGVAIEVDERALTLLEAIGDESMLEWMRRRAWSNLPILNEWRRVFPDRDPARVHRELWSEALLCPGGGEYVWNEDWRTYESTVYGHAGEPGEGPPLPAALACAVRLRAAMTFEEEGLRARVELLRD